MINEQDVRDEIARLHSAIVGLVATVVALQQQIASQPAPVNLDGILADLKACEAVIAPVAVSPDPTVPPGETPVP